MNKKISTKEKQKAQDLKSEFSKVHDQISEIQDQMFQLNTKAENLIEQLEKLRGEERNFMESLRKKYGEGSLDPMSLTYTTNGKKDINTTIGILSEIIDNAVRLFPLSLNIILHAFFRAVLA